MGITKTRKEQLKELQNQLNSLNGQIQNIIDGKSSMADFARSFGITPQDLNTNINKGPYSLLHKIEILSKSDIRLLLAKSMSPFEKLMCDVLKTDELLLLDIVEEDKFIEVLKKVLPERRYNIIAHVYGFDGNGTRTLKECSEILGVSMELIRQNVGRALRTLRHPAYLKLFMLDGLDLRVQTLKDQEAMLDYNKRLIKREEANKIALKDIEYVSVSTALYEVLNNANIHTIRDLSKFTLSELSEFISHEHIPEIERIVAALEITLGKEVTAHIELVSKTDIRVSDISDLNLSLRSYNGLTRAGIDTVTDLSKLTIAELVSIRNLGDKSIMEIIDKLKRKYYNKNYNCS